MSEEEISAALEEAKVEKSRAAEIEKYKNAVQKANSEAAKYRKEAEANLSNEEKARKEQEQLLNDLTAENKRMARELSVSKYATEYLAMGYDSVLAQSTAEAMADGDMATVLGNQKTFSETLVAKAREEVLKGTPVPGKVGTTPSVMTKEAYRKMPAAERFAYAQNHPEEYRAMYEEGEK